VARLQVLLDVAQPRVTRPRIGASARYEDWNAEDFSSTWLEPIGKTLMLRPPQLDPAWYTTNTGIYLKPSTYSYNSSGNWELIESYVGAGKYAKTHTATEWIRTSATVAKNQGVFLSYFVHNGGDDFIEAECGWSNATPDYGSDVAVRFYSGGRAEVWKDNVLVGTYTVSGRDTGAQRANQSVTYLLIPMRRRDLLVISNQGSGFIHTFEDIPEGEADPEITPAAYFWAKPGATTITYFAAQLGEIKWPSSGYATSLPIKLGKAPEVGAGLDTWTNDPWTQTDCRIFADDAFNGTPATGAEVAITLRETDGSVFAPDGTTQECKLRVDFTRIGTTHSPFFYGAHFGFTATFADTDDSEEFDLADYMIAADLSVPDNPGGVEFRCTIKSPEEVDALVPLFLTLDNRPARVILDDVVILDGVTLPPTFTDAVEDGAATCEIIIRDQMERLRSHVFREQIPLDALQLSKPGVGGVGTETYESAFEFIPAQIGIDPGDMVLSDALFQIPFVPGDDFQNLIRVGDNAYEKFDGLVQEYASNWLWGQRPTASGIQFWAVDPVDLAPAGYALYRTGDDAVTAGATESQVYWSYRESPLPIEANEVIVTGRNPRTGQAFQRFDLDADSQDPTLAPSARPDNWVGEAKLMGVLSPHITTEDAADRVIAYSLPQVSTRYWVSEWTCAFLRDEAFVPLWRGDAIDLDGRREGVTISSLQARFVKVCDDWESIPATYTGGTLTNAGGIGLDSIIKFHEMRMLQRSINRENPLVLGTQVARS
jgi:hypothetical protein